MLPSHIEWTTRVTNVGVHWNPVLFPASVLFHVLLAQIGKTCTLLLAAESLKDHFASPTVWQMTRVTFSNVVVCDVTVLKGAAPLSIWVATQSMYTKLSAGLNTAAFAINTSWCVIPLEKSCWLRNWDEKQFTKNGRFYSCLKIIWHLLW